MENASELLYMSHLCDSYAYKALFRMYEPLIAMIVGTQMKRYAGCQFSREDLLQEGRLALLVAIRTYRNDKGAKFSTYAGVVIRNKVQQNVKLAVREWYKREPVKDRDKVREPLPLYECLPAHNDMMCPEYYCAYRTGLERLSRVVAGLGEEERRVLNQYLEGYSYRKSAERLGITVKSYDGMLNRVRKKFKKCLYEDAD